MTVCTGAPERRRRASLRSRGACRGPGRESRPGWRPITSLGASAVISASSSMRGNCTGHRGQTLAPRQHAHAAVVGRRCQTRRSGPFWQVDVSTDFCRRRLRPVPRLVSGASGGTSRYCRAKRAMSRKIGAATDAAVDVAVRLVDHHEDRQSWVLGGHEADERRYVLLHVDPVLGLVRGTRLAGDRVAGDRRLGSRFPRAPRCGTSTSSGWLSPSTQRADPARASRACRRSSRRGTGAEGSRRRRLPRTRSPSGPE